MNLSGRVGDYEDYQLSDAMRYANFVSPGFAQNAIFDLKHNWNRDNCFHPYHLMRENFKNYNIEINTNDCNNGRPVVFDLHLDVQIPFNVELHYLLLLETAQIWAPNGRSEDFHGYRKFSHGTTIWSMENDS